MSIARGLAFVFSGGISQSMPGPVFKFLGRTPMLGVPLPAWVMLGLFIAAAWVMGSTVFGRWVYAVGGNAQASRLAGLPVHGVRAGVYVLSGLAAALAGVFLAAQNGFGSPGEGTKGYEMAVIAAVVLGGTSLTGGKGTVGGTLLGVLIMGVMNNGLDLLEVRSYWQDVARGVVLLLAVSLDSLRLWLSGRGGFPRWVVFWK
jgi:ribose transport system permease protein